MGVFGLVWFFFTVGQCVTFFLSIKKQNHKTKQTNKIIKKTAGFFLSLTSSQIIGIPANKQIFLYVVFALPKQLGVCRVKTMLHVFLPFRILFFPKFFSSSAGTRLL